jgi:hypothetical protein
MALDEIVLWWVIRAPLFFLGYIFGCARTFGYAFCCFQHSAIRIDYCAARLVCQERGFGDGRSVHEFLEV